MTHGRRQRAWYLPLTLAAVALIAGCGVPDTDGAEPLPSDLAAIAQPSATPSATQSAPAPRTSRVAIAWVRGDALVPRKRLVQGRSRQTVLDGALGALVAGPGAKELAAGLKTFVPPDARLAAVVSRGSVVVNLDLGLQSPIDPSLAVGQVAVTALEIKGVRRVSFVVDGSVVDVPLPRGGTSNGAVTMRDYRKVIR